MKVNVEGLKKFGFEFLSIFVGIFAAFALENWKDNQNDRLVEAKILAEIRHGLEKDLEDIKVNEMGHKQGVRAAQNFRKLITGQEAKIDSLPFHYINLFRDFISVQNISGYEVLKSKGLEVVENDSLRSHIIALYEYDYSSLRKLEEEYSETQFHKNYFIPFNTLISPHFEFDEKGNMKGVVSPLKVSLAEKNALLTYLWEIQMNRGFMLGYYQEAKAKIEQLQKEIDKELQDEKK